MLLALRTAKFFRTNPKKKAIIKGDFLLSGHWSRDQLLVFYCNV